MATTISISLSVLFLLILGIILINHFLRRSNDRKLRKWCVEQAIKTNAGDSMNQDTGALYFSKKGVVSLAGYYYEFVTHTTRATDEDLP